MVRRIRWGWRSPRRRTWRFSLPRFQPPGAGQPRHSLPHQRSLRHDDHAPLRDDEAAAVGRRFAADAHLRWNDDILVDDGTADFRVGLSERDSRARFTMPDAHH